MKAFYLTVVLSLLFTFICAGEQVEPDITGYWLTQKQDAIVEIFIRDDLYSGRIVWLDEPYEEDGSPKVDENNPDLSKKSDLIIGLEILKDFRKKKRKWSGGTIYDPDNGKTYSCNIKKNGENLDIRGYVGISLLGRTEAWTPAELPVPSPEEDPPAPMTE